MGFWMPGSLPPFSFLTSLSTLQMSGPRDRLDAGRSTPDPCDPLDPQTNYFSETGMTEDLFEIVTEVRAPTLSAKRTWRSASPNFQNPIFP